MRLLNASEDNLSLTAACARHAAHAHAAVGLAGQELHVFDARPTDTRELMCRAQLAKCRMLAVGGRVRVNKT